MQAPASHPTRLGTDRTEGGDGGDFGSRMGKGEERRWTGGAVLIGGDSLLLSLEAEAERAVTGCLGHGRFASFSLVTGLTPKATGARGRRHELLLTRAGGGAPRSGKRRRS
jgi:hypothetical protein